MIPENRESVKSREDGQASKVGVSRAGDIGQLGYGVVQKTGTTGAATGVGSLFLMVGFSCALCVVRDRGYEKIGGEPSRRFGTSGRVCGAAAGAMGVHGAYLVCALSPPSRIISGTAQLSVAHTVGGACGATSITDTVAGGESASPSGLPD
jgi:hypothetical protein